jgi:hypothetical protein
MSKHMIVEIKVGQHPKTREKQVKAEVIIDSYTTVLLMHKDTDWNPLPGIWLVKIGNVLFTDPHRLQRFQLRLMKPLVRISLYYDLDCEFKRRGERWIDSRQVEGFTIDFEADEMADDRVCDAKYRWSCSIISPGHLNEDSGVIRVPVYPLRCLQRTEEVKQLQPVTGVVIEPKPKPPIDPWIQKMLERADQAEMLANL